MTILEIFDAEIKRREKEMPDMKEEVRLLAEKHGMEFKIDAWFKTNGKSWVKLAACWNNKPYVKVAYNHYYLSVLGENNHGQSQVFNTVSEAEVYLKTILKFIWTGGK